MDENENPEWVRMLRGSTHGRKALEEIETLRRQVLMDPDELVQKIKDERARGDEWKRRAEIMWHWLREWSPCDKHFIEDHLEAASWFEEE